MSRLLRDESVVKVVQDNPGETASEITKRIRERQFYSVARSLVRLCAAGKLVKRYTRDRPPKAIYYPPDHPDIVLWDEPSNEYELFLIEKTRTRHTYGPACTRLLEFV